MKKSPCSIVTYTACPQRVHLFSQQNRKRDTQVQCNVCFSPFNFFLNVFILCKVKFRKYFNKKYGWNQGSMYSQIEGCLDNYVFTLLSVSGTKDVHSTLYHIIE